ncbi:MAG: OmpA family protein [Flavobacteriaceae bacterium]|nr:OmpA family protein [Flavobacteriaceae bacterium]
MKSFLIAFVVFLVWSFFGLWLYSWLQPVDDAVRKKDTIATNEIIESNLDIRDPLQVDKSTDILVTKKDTLGLLENEEDPTQEGNLSTGIKAITTNGDVIFVYNEGITIWKNTDQVEYPKAILDFKYKLNTYLIEHPNEELHISSLYSASENIKNPNFGYQRGMKIKRILSQTGIPMEKMVIKTVIREIEFQTNNSFDNGIYFSFHPLDTERIESRKLSLPETKTIYPKLVNNDIFVNKALQDLLKEVKIAIENNPNLKVNIVGHTDNIGNANDNYLLGLKYARQVRWYLVTKGNLDRKKVIAISEGESKSIATNRTKRGRLLNRRIEIKYDTN